MHTAEHRTRIRQQGPAIARAGQLLFRKDALHKGIFAGNRLGGHHLDRLVPQHIAIGVIEHFEGGVDPDLKGVLAQDARGHGMDRAYPGIVHLARLVMPPIGDQTRLDTTLQFSRCLLRIGNSEHLINIVQEPLILESCRDALRQREGLARSSACADHQRTIERFDDALLLGCATGCAHALTSQAS